MLVYEKVFCLIILFLFIVYIIRIVILPTTVMTILMFTYAFLALLC